MAELEEEFSHPMNWKGDAEAQTTENAKTGEVHRNGSIGGQQPLGPPC
jgi:hypothetical protein